MNAYTAMVIYNLALFVLIGVCVWITKSAWPLLGLLCTLSIQRGPANTFVISEDDTDDE